MLIQGVFLNWCPPKIHKYGIKLKYQNWCPPKNSKYQPVRKFWHLGLLWRDLLCNLTLRTFWGGTSWDLEIIGGHQFESSKHFTYRKTLTSFRGAPVKKNTLYNFCFTFPGLPCQTTSSGCWGGTSSSTPASTSPGNFSSLPIGSSTTIGGIRLTSQSSGKTGICPSTDGSLDTSTNPFLQQVLLKVEAHNQSIRLFTGWSRGAAITMVFLVSSFFHEYTVSVPLRMLKPWLFIGFMFNAPLVEAKQNLHDNKVKETPGATERMAGGEIWSKGWQPQHVAFPRHGPAFAGW